jgi:hypothetical protein
MVHISSVQAETTILIHSVRRSHCFTIVPANLSMILSHSFHVRCSMNNLFLTHVIVPVRRLGLVVVCFRVTVVNVQGSIKPFMLATRETDLEHSSLARVDRVRDSAWESLCT